ncbi:MAG: hypothetical protein IRZ05_20010 [Micromonosporaceae bacterium]|nr:hypothetical protein [Micromonosporaceae bacterium]
MRRTISLAAAAAAAILVATVPASAAVNAGTPAGEKTTTRPAGEWVLVPSAPFDLPAGARCDFPVHGEPVVDKVQKMVLKTFPDGSVKQEMYVGALIFRVTNTATGASVDVDISGTGVVTYRPGGANFNNGTSHIQGPILLGVAENGGNLPRGLYVPNGIYTLTISETGFRTVKWQVDGGLANICEELQAGGR